MLNFDDEYPLLVTCARGLAPTLSAEIEALLGREGQAHDTGVTLYGTLLETYRLNLHLRTAFHVLLRIAEFECDDGDELYGAVRTLPWEEIVPIDGYVSVASRVNTPSVTNTMYPNLKVKDAIVDRIQDCCGRRPDSGPKRDETVVTLHWFGEQARLYVDTSGRKLSDRGYRRAPHKAPLRETLAAGILLEAGYDGTKPVANPMCGSGTLAIEAALLGSGRAPGLLRGEFGLKFLQGYDAEVWNDLRADARRAKSEAPAPIVASDRDPKAIKAANFNAKTAGVDGLVRFEVCDFREATLPEEPGLLLINPEYGERLGNDRDLRDTYRALGDYFKQELAGWEAWLITGSRPLAKQVGLRASRRKTLYNGEIECRLLRYEMYSGSKKQKHSNPPQVDPPQPDALDVAAASPDEAQG